MDKIRAKYEKAENGKAYLGKGDSEIIMPESALTDFKIGEEVVILLSDSETDVENSNEVAKALLTEVFKEDK